MTRRHLLLVAVACSLVLSGCLGGTNPFGADSGPDGTTELVTTEPAPTAETTTASAPRRAIYDTYDALADNASFSVPDPEVPPAFEFQSGIVMELDDGEHVAIAYHRVENGSPANVVSIRKAENESTDDLRAGNATTVGDREARYVESDGGAKLLWQCDGYVYRVSVREYTDRFGEEQLRAVAESVGCE